jgi:hypothetical protein
MPEEPRKKRRGRPPQAAAVEITMPPVVEEPIRKRRGRPPRAAAAKITMPPVVEEPIRKRRGRPPRAATVEITMPPVVEEPIRKRRGRPPRAAAAEITMPPAVEEPPKKRRGRPPKAGWIEIVYETRELPFPEEEFAAEEAPLEHSAGLFEEAARAEEADTAPLEAAPEIIQPRTIVEILELPYPSDEIEPLPIDTKKAILDEFPLSDEEIIAPASAESRDRSRFRHGDRFRKKDKRKGRSPRQWERPEGQDHPEEARPSFEKPRQEGRPPQGQHGREKFKKQFPGKEAPVHERQARPEKAPRYEPMKGRPPVSQYEIRPLARPVEKRWESLPPPFKIKKVPRRDA